MIYNVRFCYFLIQLLKCRNTPDLALRIITEPRVTSYCVMDYPKIQRLEVIINIRDVTQLLWMRRLGAPCMVLPWAPVRLLSGYWPGLQSWEDLTGKISSNMMLSNGWMASGCQHFAGALSSLPTGWQVFFFNLASL